MLDNIYNDDDIEENRMVRLIEINKAILMLDNGSTDDSNLNEQLKIIENSNHVKLKKNKDLKRELLMLSDEIYMEHTDENAEYVAVISALVSFGIGMYPKRFFDRSTSLPFENITIRVPKEYDDFLRIIYGDYMVKKKSGGSHDYPLYWKEEKLLADKFGENPYRYTFSRQRLSEIIKLRENKKSTNEICMEMLGTLGEAITIMKVIFDDGDLQGAVGIMENCQELTIALGTVIEERIPQSRDAVSILEEFCELLYETHESPDVDTISALLSEYGRIGDTITTFLKNRKRRVLFLPSTARWWDSMQTYYRRCIEDSHLDVSVLSVPYYEMYYDGSVEMIDKAGDFAKGVNAMPVTEYDFEHRYADEIVIQIPYDETSTVIRLPKFFYSDNLLNYTDRLTYIPYLRPEGPKESDERSIKALSVFVEQPAVLYSDKIILESEALKKVYMDRLVELAGDRTREYWNDKLLVEVETIK